MAMLSALIGLCLVVGSVSIQGTAEEYVRTGMPPFVFLSPPSFKAGHMTNLKLMMFTENAGNISIKYYNYTRQYYPENLYQ